MDLVKEKSRQIITGGYKVNNRPINQNDAILLAWCASHTLRDFIVEYQNGTKECDACMILHDMFYSGIKEYPKVYIERAEVVYVKTSKERL